MDRDQDRQHRLAEALRANLRKRKAGRAATGTNGVEPGDRETGVQDCIDAKRD